MGIVTLPTVFVDGTIPTASQFNGDFNAITNEINGNLSAANVDSTVLTTTGTQTVTNKDLSSSTNTLPAITSKVLPFLRDVSSASGDVSYTGVGFTPSTLEFDAVIDNTQASCHGFSDSARNQNGRYTIDDTHAGIISYDIGAGICIFVGLPSSGGYQTASVKTYDADGFTLTWTKSGSPTGNCHFTVRAFK